MSTDWKQLLVDGFVRNIVQNFQQITPSEINGLCLRFCFLYAESLQQLKQKRKEASKANELETKLKIEKYILWEVSYDPQSLLPGNCNKLLFNEKSLREVLNHWISTRKVDELREIIVEAALQCIKNDNVKILEIILKHCGYDQSKKRRWMYSRNDELVEFVNHSAKHSSFDCIQLLFSLLNGWNWRCSNKWSTDNCNHQRRPVCLLNAVKYHSDNMELINFIIKELKRLKLPLPFVCDQIMKEAIQKDLVDVAKSLINNRWHDITNDDELEAQLIDGECHKWFVERSDATKINYIDKLNQNEDVIDLDDDEWEDNNEDNDIFSEEDDWEKDVD